MEMINVNNWAVSSEIKEATYQYDMGYITRFEFACWCYVARAPYVGKVHNILLFVRDRWF